MQLLQALQQQCEALDAELRQLWLSPDSIELSNDLIGSGASSTVQRAVVRGTPAAVKLYHGITLVPPGPGAGPSVDQLTCKGLQRELCIIARANREFQYACRCARLPRWHSAQIWPLLWPWACTTAANSMSHVCTAATADQPPSPVPGTCRYLGVSVLRGQPAIVMRLYHRGSLAAAVEASGGAGLELGQALRWARTYGWSWWTRWKGCGAAGVPATDTGSTGYTWQG